MIRCLVTATSASRRLLDASQRSADRILIDAIDAAVAHGHDLALVDEPEAADLIVFAESHQNDGAIYDVLGDALFRRYRSKCVVHCGMDHPVPLIPGLYPSIDRRWARRLHCFGSPYLASLNPFIDTIDATGVEVDRLASFMGACEGKAVRTRLLDTALERHWTDVAVHDSGPAFVGSAQSADREAHLDLKRSFAVMLLQSKFALCPRGAGASSFRIYEAMQSGRAPVVIADDWTPPRGPDWDSFLIHIAESDIPRIPQILRDRQSQWEVLGERAREQWERFYEPSVLGWTVISNALDVLVASRASPSSRALSAWFYVHGPRRLGVLGSRVAAKWAGVRNRLV